jgi:hypothetical protein
MPPFDSGGTYSLPSGYTAVADTTILTTQHNPPLEDIAAALTACVKRNGAGAMTGLLTLSGDPSSALQAATKQYVDAQVAAAVAAAGITIKAPVLLCTTGNVTLSGEQTIDGTLTSGNRVLVAHQTAPAENGIYLTASGAWARSTDCDAWTEVTNAIVPVEKGTAFGDTIWFSTADAGGTLNTTAIYLRRVDGKLITNAQTGTTYTVLHSDHFRLVTLNNASAIAVTLPQATTAFGKGFTTIFYCLGAGEVTITPTTSTIGGASTLLLQKNQAAIVVSDGTNYDAIRLGAPGKATIWVPSGAMVARTTNGAASGSVETTTNKVMIKTLDFDATTAEFAQFSVQMPKGWNEGTVTFVPVWSHPATATNFGVAWTLAGFAFSDDDALDQAFGTAITVTDTGGTTNDLYRGTESAAVTIGGTPAESDLVIFQVGRDPANGSDTMAVDARLHGVAVFITYDTPTDR